MESCIPRINEALFFQCDIQENFRSKIYKSENVAHVARYMAKTSEVLGVPLLVSEQNPKVFGSTFKEIQAVYPKTFTLFEKSLFSMLTNGVLEYLKTHSDRKTVVLYGIEAHICIQQTALALRALGYNVFLPVDGVSSQTDYDRSVALQRMRDAGVILTTSESLVFELLEKGEGPLFKKMLSVIKDKMPHAPAI